MILPTTYLYKSSFTLNLQMFKYEKLIYVCSMNIHYSRNIPKCCANSVYPHKPDSHCILLFTVLYSHHFHVLGTLPMDYILSWINPFHIWQCSYHLPSTQLFITFYQRITWLRVLTTELLSAVH
jgi:hypothetical protein